MVNVKQKNEKAVGAGKASAAARKERLRQLIETLEKRKFSSSLECILFLTLL